MAEQCIITEAVPRKPYLEVLAEIRRRQKVRRHQPPSLEEVNAYLNAERESWGE